MADQITLIATLAFATGFASALLVVLTIHIARRVRALEATARAELLRFGVQP